MSQVLDIGSDKQLFIDDFCIEQMQGVRRHLNQPKKHPANPLMVPEMPWEATYVQLYGNVIYDASKKTFEMWYSARDDSRVNTVCHATSKDGIQWERSRFNIVPFEGNEHTNILIRGPYIGPTVFHTPNDPDPERRYRMFVYMGPELLNAGERHTAFSHAYGVLFSPDGLHWTEYENNPVIQGGDIATCCYDPVRDEYISFPKIHRSDEGVVRRCTALSRSTDFTTWSAPNIILSADAIDDARSAERLRRHWDVLCYIDPAQTNYPSADIYGTTGFRYEGLRLGLMWFYDRSAERPEEHGANDDGIINVQLAYSRGEYWHRAGDRQDFLTCGSADSYDAGMLIPAHTVVEVDDELWFYYTGTNYGHGWFGDEPGLPSRLSKEPARKACINLATLRRDGFISLDALYPEGYVTTKLLTFQGRELEINADAERGQIVAEICDEAGTPIPGYSRADCIPFRKDAIRGRIQWKDGRDVTELQGKPVRVRFFIGTAKLYAFKFC